MDEIIIPQIIEENGLVYEQTNESGCISRIQTGTIVDGEVVPIVVETVEPIPTVEEKIEILTEKVEQLESLVL
jgi:hypothetical protein